MSYLAYQLISMCINSYLFLVIDFLEQPKSQHVTIGSNVTFSCIVEPIIDVSWYAYYSDDTFKAVLTQDAEGVINRTKVRSDNRISTTLTLVATQSWNGTIIRCYAEQGHGYLSDRAYLMVYSSLRKHHSIIIFLLLYCDDFPIYRATSTIPLEYHNYY